MTLLELVTFLRDNILDDNGGEGVDWTSYSDSDFDSIQLRWENEELVTNINEAINQVYRRTNYAKDILTFDASTGVREYSLPSYVTEVTKMKLSNGVELKEKSMNELWELKTYNTKTGTPSLFIPDEITNTISLHPIPIVDETISYFCYRLPKVKLSWDSKDSSPELKGEYQLPMLNYAAFLCYMKDEANVLDPGRAATFSALFDREFPFTSAYSNIRKSRTSNRPVRYGGI